MLIRKIFLAASIVFFSQQSFAQDKIDPLRYCYYDYEMAPFYQGAGAEVPPIDQRGLVIDVMDQVGAEIGLPLEWVRRPWPRCLAMMAEGQVDGLVGVNFTPERGQKYEFPHTKEGELDISRTLTPLSYYFFYNIYNPIQWDGEKFDRKRVSIASPRGFVVTQLLRDKGFSHVQEMGAAKGFQALLDRKIDVYVESMVHYGVARKTLSNLDIRLKRLTPSIYTSYMFNPVSKTYYQRYPDLVERFWTGQAQHYSKWDINKE